MGPNFSFLPIANPCEALPYFSCLRAKQESYGPKSKYIIYYFIRFLARENCGKTGFGRIFFKVTLSS